MDVELVGQLYSFGRDLSEIRISICPHREDSFCVFVSYSGDSTILTYEIKFLDVPEATQNETKRRKHSDSDMKQRRRKNYRLTFVKSHVLPFPIYFLVSIKDRTWAVSHNAQREMKLSALEVSGNDPKNFASDQPMDVDSNEFDEPMGCGKFKRNSVCCVSKFSGGILVCRDDFLQNCWAVELVRTNREPTRLFSVPFVSSPISSFGASNVPEFICSPGRGTSATLKHMPTIFCIEVETEFNKRNENVLKKDKFVALFGCNLSSNTVALIGLPDGRILWQFINLPDACNAIKGETKFHLLCNIEQPVRHISTQPYKETAEICHIIVIGTYGKVMIILPEEETSNHCNTDAVSSNPFTISVSHIPSPVNEVAVCHQGLLHTSSDGQLWMSTFSCEKMVSSSTSCEPNIVLNFQQLSYYGIKNMVVLNHKKGIVMCIGSSGSIHVGNFFRTKSVDHSVAEEEMPLLLKSIYLYGNQLQELEGLAQKQRRLFSALAVAAKIKFQADDHKVSIACKVTEIPSDVQKFFIAVEFQNLNGFNLDHELWTLSTSVSSVQDEKITVSQISPLSQGSPCITIEIDPSLFTNPIFPLLVEAGLLLDIPTEWKSLGCFESVISNLPLYIRLQTVLVNELYLLKENDLSKWNETSVDQFEQYGCRGVFRALQKIARSRSSCSHFQAELTVKNYSLPQEFSFPVFASSVESILKNGGLCSSVESADLPEKLIQVLLRRSNDIVGGVSSSYNFSCLGNRVSISVNRSGNFLRITVCCSSFTLLVGLKISMISLLKEANLTESTEKNIIMSSNLHAVLQALSIKISRLLCQDRSDITQEDLEVYKKLREDISSNLHIL